MGAVHKKRLLWELCAYACGRKKKATLLVGKPLAQENRNKMNFFHPKTGPPYGLLKIVYSQK
jgi:hypothetical protein